MKQRLVAQSNILRALATLDAVMNRAVCSDGSETGDIRYNQNYLNA